MQLQQQMRKGSTPVLILSLLTEEPMYGYQIAQELASRSEGYFEMQEGLLYPALHQMEKDGLLRSEWHNAAETRRRKYYFVTDEGYKVLNSSVAEWQNFFTRLMDIIGGQREPQPAMGGGL